jgi:contact-dependent growth inhibition (CDI) system CdiI-like immunity protein
MRNTMNLNIEFIETKPKKGYCLGKISVPDQWWQTFRISMEIWTIEDYVKQWTEGLDRIKNHDNSVLVYSFNKNIIWTYSLHKKGSDIYMQERGLTHDSIEPGEFPLPISAFNHDTCYQFIDSFNEDYQSWIIPV